MSVGNLLSGLVQGFADRQKEDREGLEKNELKKLQIKLFKHDLDQKEKTESAKKSLVDALTKIDQSLFQGNSEEGTPNPQSHGLQNFLKTPQGQATALQAGYSLKDLKEFQSPDLLGMLASGGIPGMSGQGKPGGFEPTGIKFDTSGKPMIDFGRNEVWKEIPSPDGREMVGIDKLGRHVTRRQIGPSERAEEDRPIPPAQLPLYKSVDGKMPPPGTTLREIQQKGYKQVSDEEQKAEVSQRGAYAVLDRMDELVDKTFPKTGLMNRISGGGGVMLNKFTQENPDAIMYESIKAGTLGPMIRALGDRGALAEGDVERAIKLLPILQPTPTQPIPDSKEIAKQKLKQIRDILKQTATGEKDKKSDPLGIR
jgi:hypothetical protein